MSGPLLLGIAAAGVGWAYVTRDIKKADPPPVPPADAAADEAIVGNETSHSTGGAAAVIGSMDGDCPPTIVGDIPVSGTDGGFVAPIEKVIEGNIVIGDSDKSTGGADPSTQATAMSRIAGLGADKSPPPISGDSESSVVESIYGTEDGLCTNQIAAAYSRSAFWSGEVW